MHPDAPLVAPAPGLTVPDRELRRLERGENFPVALRVLPARVRSHLRAVYDVARVIDDAGDEAPGDRSALLDEIEAQVRRVWSADPPATGVFAALVPTARACGLAPEPFLALVEANRLDQTVQRYATWADLRHYCSLSADPVGRLVLAVFGAATVQRVGWSDDVCTALQLLEHLQDVAEDRRRGRVYLPQEDLARFGVDEAALDRPGATTRVRALVAFETNRAASLLDAGSDLVSSLTGWARVAVAGYVGGGHATIRAIRRCRYDVLAGPPSPRRRDVARRALLAVSGLAGAGAR